MNTAALLISKTFLREYHEDVILGLKSFKIYQPTIKEMISMFNGLDLSVNEKTNNFDIIFSMPEHVDDACRSISKAVTLKRPFMTYLAFNYIIRFASVEQIHKAAETLSSVISGDKLFKACHLEKSSETIKTEFLGNTNMMGQVASFMENLHLSYKEVFEDISYPQLLMMSADKLRISTGEKERVVSGRDLLKKKKK